METKQKPFSVLNSKRGLNLLIFLKSAGVEISAIEAVVYNLEACMPLEVLEKLVKVQATEKELASMKEYVNSGANKEVPLDKADHFLLDLAAIPCLDERLTCFMYLFSFADSCANIETNLVVLRTVCQFITTSEDMNRIFNEIVSCGNYLNGGDKNLGQADGFNVDLLPKIKDTKRTDNQSNLLEYIVRPCCLREITPKVSWSILRLSQKWSSIRAARRESSHSGPRCPRPRKCGGRNPKSPGPGEAIPSLLHQDSEILQACTAQEREVGGHKARGVLQHLAALLSGLQDHLEEGEGVNPSAEGERFESEEEEKGRVGCDI